MTDRATAVVTTTIHVPRLLEGYLENAARYGHRGVLWVIAGDRKTPDRAVEDLLAGLRRRFGEEMIFFPAARQEEAFAAHRDLLAHLPWNVIQRRNLSTLYAYQRGAEVIVTIDDDNFVREGDYLGAHSVVGRPAALESFASDSGWFNVCRFLEERTAFPFYPRGYPLGARWKDGDYRARQAEGRVAVNAGLWLGVPDVDALTHLYKELRVEGYARPANFALEPGTWAPFNSQNTALLREVIPAYFLSPAIGRYDDIWAAYVVRAISDHLGDRVSYGFPLVAQERNPHDFFRDFENERAGMRLSDALCAFLRGVRLAGNDYCSCCRELAAAGRELVERTEDRADRETFARFFQGLSIWNGIFSSSH